MLFGLINRSDFAIWYFRYLHLCVPMCINHNSSPVPARITKFRPEVQNTMVKILNVLGSNRPRHSLSNLIWKRNFIQFWACPREQSLPIQVWVSKFGPKMHLSTVKIPINLGFDRPWPSISFLISNAVFLTNWFTFPLVSKSNSDVWLVH